MYKPDFKQVKEILALFSNMDTDINSINNSEGEQKNAITEAAIRVKGNIAIKLLDDISVSELKNSKAGIRTSAIEAAGYSNLGQIAAAKDYEILQIEGIGEKQLEAIKNVLTDMGNQLSEHVSMQLGIDSNDEDMKKLLSSIAVYRKSALVRNDVKPLWEDYHNFHERIKAGIRIRNSVHWLFSGRVTKEETCASLDEALGFLNQPVYERLCHLIDLFIEAQRMTWEQVVSDYTKSSADYYAILDSLGNIKTSKPLIYSSIPQQLAADIDAQELDTSLFIGNLRSYQTFGAKYILHQGKVLLGDEMGLGKTVQAIAAIAHIAVKSEKSFFLVICPASVLVNWCREIQKFSKVNTHLVYGEFLEDVFADWQENGGVAVTNYESMGKIVDRIDNNMHLDMLLIDEAHYMKNPDAKRTQYIRRLDNESERILMMTGTPLENRVEEMCNLIDFIRPDMTKKIKENAFMNQVSEFKELLSPVYIRRLRSQVLEELPPVEERQVWCSMSMEDLDSYREAIDSKSFPAARRVGFLQEDISTSAKAVRLKEICENAGDNGRRVVVFSFFRETISKVRAFLGDKCVGEITGSTPITERQDILDRFGESPEGSVLICQVQSGGTGLNIQHASIAIFCEPQIKPSLTNQAIARLHRMGQVRD
nr:DEAD/DEAH box helicase [Butyrivibrio sp.]